MTHGAYYNENDLEKAEWLRELIRQGVVADGDVDTRSIKEIEPQDFAGYAQCHFFAGIGVWSYALRLAGWPDDRSVWTGSCPCPSFSAAGKGGGFNDPRHLWPDWARLIRLGKPATIFGEQADDAIGYGWLDLVQTDLERENYAVGKAVLGACSVGAPHIRQRLYFVANAAGNGLSQRSSESGRQLRGEACTAELRSGDAVCGMEHADSERRREARLCERESGTSGTVVSERMADADGRRLSVRRKSSEGQRDREQRSANVGMGDSHGPARAEFGREVHQPEEKSGEPWFGNGNRRDGHSGPGYVNGFWRDADWILRKRWNRDDWEWCPTEPGTFPLVAGTAARVLRLRGYGDAIVPQVAAAFIAAARSSQ